MFAAASEAFSQRNINCSISDSLKRFEPIMEAARSHGVRVRGYVSCVLGCPYEGKVSAEQVAPVARALHDMGCYEVSLGDTIGTGTAGDTRRLFEVVSALVPREQLAGHFHDTYGQALANVYASSSKVSMCSTARWQGWVAALMPKALPATSPRKMWCTCCRGWALLPVSTWTG